MAKINTTKSTSLKLPTSPDGYDRRDQDLTRRLIESAFATFSLGIQQSSGGDVKVGDPGVTVGTGLLDFGSFPGESDTALVITGQALIKAATSVVWAWVFPKDTADHSADEHIADPPRIIAGNVVDGVGFTIYGVMPVDEILPDLLVAIPGTQLAQIGSTFNNNLTWQAQGFSGTDTGSPQDYGHLGEVRLIDNNRMYGKWTVAWAWR